MFLKRKVEPAEEDRISILQILKKSIICVSCPLGLLNIMLFTQLEALYSTKSKFRNPGML